MTWVVGTAVPFGYGLGISDIRVTLADGSERDCLQKIYPVGQFIAGAFAGSVRIGFAMLHRLSQLLNHVDKYLAWDPKAVAEWWPSDAIEVFQRFPDSERDLQAQIMIIGAHPTENNGDAPWPKCYVFKFQSPSFEPVQASGTELIAIGCGAAVEPCRQAIEPLSSDPHAMFQIWQGEVNNPGGAATMLGFNLTTVLKRTQPRGISSHLHYCWVYRGRIVIKTNDHTTFGPWTRLDSGVGDPNKPSRPSRMPEDNEPGAAYFRMPKIASSLKELEELLRAEGVSTSGIVA